MAGPFFFAWVDLGEPFDEVTHAREDEQVLSFDISHNEGELPSLSIVVKNPKIGLLAPGRKVWAWFSVMDGDEIAPLFFGRLIGIPSDLLAEACTLLFVAKPVDFMDQKIALAESMKVRPWYDPVWIDEASRDDPDTVLEAYSALWHIDRVTHEVTVSDILVGEDGLADFTQDDAFYDSVSITLNQAPLVSINVEATVEWTQTGSGAVDLGTKTILSHSDSVFSGWPKAGDNIGAGWSVAASAVNDFGTSNITQITGSTSYSNKETTHVTGDTMSASQSWSYPSRLGGPNQALVGGLVKRFLNREVVEIGMIDAYADPPVNRGASHELEYTLLFTVMAEMSISVRYDAKRKRTEKLSFTLNSDLQDIVTLPLDSNVSDHETISLTGSGDLPIADPAGRSYFPTDRGLWSLEYLISLARAHLVARSRAVEIGFECRLSRVIDLSCRKTARLFDPRLPGGSAIGKIISYSIKGDGDQGQLIGVVKMGCAIGYGGAVSADPGTPSYGEDGYVNDGYQYYSDSVVVLGASDIGYSVPIDDPDDDGLVFPLDYRQVVVRNEIVGSVDDTTVKATPKYISTGFSRTVERTDYEFGPSTISYELELLPTTNGPFDNEFAIVVTDLQIPKMIDLEAASA